MRIIKSGLVKTADRVHHVLPSQVAPRRSQKGTTLLVVMILVIVSTFLGLAAFEDSGVAIQVVNNDQYRQVAFRAAEGSASRFITEDNIKAIVNSANDSMTDTTNLIAGATTETKLKFEGVGLAKNFSLGEGIGGFVPYKFTSRAKVTMQGLDAKSVVIQGAEQYAPKL